MRKETIKKSLNTEKVKI